MVDAVREAVITNSTAGISRASYTVFWEGLDSDDSGAVQQLSDYADRTVQVVGTFGSGGSISLQGSNDGTTWAILTDPTGVALTFTSTGLRAVTEATRYVRPLVTAGDGTTDLDVYLFLTGGEIK